MLVSGSNDIVSTVVTEQIHPFVWLQTDTKYLAMLEGGTHFSSKPGRDGAGGIFALLAGQNRDVGSRYYKLLSVAFWNAHLRDQEEFLPYLTARYGEAISEGQPMGLDIISQLTTAQLEAAYGGSTPIPVIPAALAPPPAPREESVLAEIERTGVLKIGMRKDAAPFGFINRDEAWDGYCGDLALSLADYLTQELELDRPIEVVELTSTLSDRYDQVRNDTTSAGMRPQHHPDRRAGSDFFQSHLYRQRPVPDPGGADRPGESESAAGGGCAWECSATPRRKPFVQTNYPRANIVTFSGPDGRKNAIQEVSQGNLDGFVGDGILTYAALQLEGRPMQNFALIPELPLTCEFYGLALPDNDPEWQTMVNQY